MTKVFTNKTILSRSPPIFSSKNMEVAPKYSCFTFQVTRMWKFAKRKIQDRKRLIITSRPQTPLYVHTIKVLTQVFCSILINWGCLTSPTSFFLVMSQLDWSITKKKVETMEASQNRRSYGKMECLPLWPTCIGEKGRTLGKTYEIKARCYWEHPWEPNGNFKGTCWEQKNWKKILLLPPHPPPPKLKRKIKWMGVEPSHDCMKFLFPKLLVTIFGLGNTPIINWGYLFIDLSFRWWPKLKKMWVSHFQSQLPLKVYNH